MQLLAIPDLNGRPVMWINADHLTSVMRIELHTGRDVQLFAELKIDGMPLYKVPLAEFETSESADAKWDWFLQLLQQG